MNCGDLCYVELLLVTWFSFIILNKFENFFILFIIVNKIYYLCASKTWWVWTWFQDPTTTTGWKDCSERAGDVEKIVENLVFQHLVRIGYDVKIGQLYSTEIDFVGTKGDEVVYVQAAYLITEEKTFEREFGNLMPIKDSYPKYVISMTPYMDSSKWKGIIHIPLVEFLKNGFGK